MTTKQWLSRAINLETEIAELRAQRLDEWERVTKATQGVSGDVIQSSNDPHKFDRISELVDLYDAVIDKRIAVRGEIFKAISICDKQIYRRILMKKYLEGKTFDTIAEEVKMSKRHVERLHGRALIEMGGIISAIE